ncbi:MAG TPA: hypothetical protein VMF66_05175 [Candidatus Acidoferrum sp.]|nr:hypothetical protein [Candidatus Acidoferrum sp.]
MPQTDREYPEAASLRPNGSFLIRHKLPIILFLLVAVAGLATIAKDGQCYRGSNPVHQYSLSTKMVDAQTPVVPGSSPLQAVARVVASKPRPTRRMRIDNVPLPAQPVGLQLSFSHRSPPVVSL